MFYEKRTTCLLTGTDTLEVLSELKNFPVFIGCTNDPESSDIRADMVFDVCTKTGFIQLRNLLPLNVVYSQYHSEALGGVWQSHHLELAKFILKHNPKNVLELGGSSGVLANLCLTENPELSWTIVEPNPSEVMPNPAIRLINGYFDKNFQAISRPDAIVHSHLLEHLYDPLAALEHMGKILDSGGMQIFSVPNLQKWLENKFPNALNFEHTLFLSENFVDYLLSLYGFKILEKQYFQEHSIFYAAEKSEGLKPLPLPSQYEENKKLYLNFLDYYISEAKNLNQKINEFNGPVFLFGAHIFSQSLLFFGLNEAKIKGILDNSKIKQGKRLYGSNLKVMEVAIVKDLPKAAVILRAGVYNSEIREQLEALNSKLIIL